jgi:hypothetical protein
MGLLNLDADLIFLPVDPFRLFPQIYLSFSRKGANIKALKDNPMFFVFYKQ